MHTRPLILMPEGPGPRDSQRQAEFTLGLEGRQHSAWLACKLRAHCVQLIYVYLGIYYAFYIPHLDARRPWSLGLSRAGKIHFGFRGHAVFTLVIHTWEYIMHSRPPSQSWKALVLGTLGGRQNSLRVSRTGSFLLGCTAT
jgi:hypothetical protein